MLTAAVVFGFALVVTYFRITNASETAVVVASPPTAVPTLAPSSVPPSSSPLPSPHRHRHHSPTPSDNAATDLTGDVAPTGNLPGWNVVYSQNFTGDSLPSGWGPYSGEPGGDPFGYWDPSNVSVSDGELHLRTTPNDDPNRSGTSSTGGVAFFGKPQTYGMYLVRMKGDYEPNLEISDVALLWPQDNSWPPEIDFYEDHGGVRNGFDATVHPGTNNDDCCVVHTQFSVDGTEWHTYGVAWTPDTITYTVDGTPIGSVNRGDIAAPGEWPSTNMILALQSDNLGPAQPAGSIETMTVKWVAEYAQG
jgi:beta-glucanase (GH16 family)